MFVTQISGGHLPPSFRYDLTQITEHPNDGTVGVVVLFSGGDFAMVDASGISNETIYELSAQEESSILEMESAPHQGNAGGIFYFSKNLDHHVKLLSPATKHTQVFIAKQDATSTRLTVVYVSCLKGAPATKTYPGIYNDVLMQ